MNTFAIIGAGNGGKATAADLALQGKAVRLFEFPEFAANIAELRQCPRLNASGDVAGEAVLAGVTSDLAEAVEGADAIVVVTQATAHERVATELAPIVRPNQFVLLNPGSTGGSLEFARVFREHGVQELPLLGETGTLTYGCRGTASDVNVYLKVRRVVYGTFPADRSGEVADELEALFPGLVRVADVLAAGLTNANPVIHPAITILNAARIEKEGPGMHFYRDGVSPSVAKLIEKVDRERMALMTTLGYSPQTDAKTSKQQGYAESEDYYECYARGEVFGGFTSPNTLDHRYFHEDIGMGLVLFCTLG
ncbi:MAG: NAD(P)-binding domain-containing protein, partial [Lentisphaerae bacterium]|nr:NAD(P)-binding domain-containing protein [Lentisphaerota bacterium]